MPKAYDAIVVGSGPRGGWAAMDPLTTGAVVDPSTKNDGDNVCACTVNPALVAPPVVSFTDTDPCMASGGVRMFT